MQEPGIKDSVLVLGATGQIGNALTHGLIDKAPRVTVLVRKPAAFPECVKVNMAPVFTREAFKDALAGIDHVVYALGAPNQWMCDQGAFQRANIQMLENCLAAMAETGVSKLTYISTFEIFAAQGKVIREEHSISESELPQSFETMRQAFRILRAKEGAGSIRLLTIHPAAVYGGINTANGFTDYLLNLVNRKILRSPAIVAGKFPLVHVDSLVQGTLSALAKSDFGQAYILSDGMTSLREMAVALKLLRPRAYMPFRIPQAMAESNAIVSEWVSRFVTGKPPLVARDHLKFITQEYEPIAEKAEKYLGWKPMSLDDGLRRFLERYRL
ncbi:MAG: NAD-dependent epimerase/dehydratase family protein [Fibrobacterota bacterium]|nr:NAD-dependent epimerase/dehydratase family protein [Fibrobacterota bacterium]